jgi:hypothetical protein
MSPFFPFFPQVVVTRVPSGLRTTCSLPFLSKAYGTYAGATEGEGDRARPLLSSLS